MKWRKLSKTTRTLIVMFTVLLVCGLLPLLLVDHNVSNSEDLHEISHLVEKLEAEHKELTALIASLESDNKDHIAKLSKPRTVPQPPDRIEESKKVVGDVPDSHNKADSIPAPVVPVIANEKPAERPHAYRRPITFNTPSSRSAESVLVVGGTDGSGTRRVVQILTQLGVTMVSEDPETYDIHGDIVGGWPTVVTPVLEYTENIAYEPSTLPEDIRSRISTALQRLLNLVDSDSHKSESHTLAVGGVLRKPLNVNVKSVKYGFKAPVAMTLAPFWAFLLRDFKMLHVLRDGRDISFSANQGPVQKFFMSMYKRNVPLLNERVELKAVRLWSDWNLGLKQWAEKKVKTDAFNAGKSFGYYALHSEDLVDEDRGVRYGALVNLAAWIGSDISDKDLCCIAVSGSKFMGSHDRTSHTAPNVNALSTRYGKWKKRLLGDPSLSSSMHSIGGPALKEFGYEPSRDLGDINMESVQPEDAYSNFPTVIRTGCTLQPEDCSPLPLSGQNNLNNLQDDINAEVWGMKDVCKVTKGIDYKGGDLSLFSISLLSGATPDHLECCRRCKELPGCSHFTIDTDKLLCYLKGEGGSIIRTGMTVRLVSGDML